MKIQKIFLVLMLLGANLYLIKAQEENHISQVCNDIKVEIGKKLLENGGSLTDLFSYLSINKKFNGLHNRLQKHIEKYIKENKDNLFEMAAREGSKYTIELLLKEKTMTSIEKDFALKSAVMGGRIEIVKLLLKEKDVTPEHKGPALKYAAMGGHKEIVKLLLKEEDISFKDKADALKCCKDIIEKKKA